MTVYITYEKRKKATQHMVHLHSACMCTAGPVPTSPILRARARLYQLNEHVSCLTGARPYLLRLSTSHFLFLFWLLTDKEEETMAELHSEAECQSGTSMSAVDSPWDMSSQSFSAKYLITRADMHQARGIVPLNESPALGLRLRMKGLCCCWVSLG